MSFISWFRWPMRKALFSPLLAVIACLMVAATPTLAQVVVSSPVPGNGTDGNEQCASGTYATNRSESNIAVDPNNTSHMLGLSKFFFSSPSSSGTDWSSVYLCWLLGPSVLENRDTSRKQPGALKTNWPILSACHAGCLADHWTPVGSVDL